MLNRLDSCIICHWVYLFVEIFGAEVAKVGERKYRLPFLGFVGGDLNKLFFLYDFYLSLEEAFTADHLGVFYDYCLHLG